MRKIPVEPGRAVLSTAGRDCGKRFVALQIEGDYAYIANGGLRTVEKPKKKKCIHLQPTGHVETTLTEKLENGSYLLDAEIAQVLKAYRK